MSDFKYIILAKGNHELPVIFPGNFVHAHVSETLRAMLAIEAMSLMPAGMRDHPKVKQELLRSIQPVAAGEVQFSYVKTFGQSTTLGLQSRFAVDADLITTFPYAHGLKL